MPNLSLVGRGPDRGLPRRVPRTGAAADHGAGRQPQHAVALAAARLGRRAPAVGARPGRAPPANTGAPYTLVTGIAVARPVHRQRAGLAAGRARQREVRAASKPCSPARATRCRPRWRRCWPAAPTWPRPPARRSRFLDRCLEAGFRPGMGHVLPDRFFWALPRGRGGADEPAPTSRSTSRQRALAACRPPRAPAIVLFRPDAHRALDPNQQTLFERAQRRHPRRRELAGARLPAPWAARRASSRAAQGAYFWDADGKRYIDYIGSWGPMILGHGHPAVVEAVQKAVTGGLLVRRADRARDRDWPRPSSRWCPRMREWCAW